jgi:hypothetical protein
MKAKMKNNNKEQHFKTKQKRSKQEKEKQVFAWYFPSRRYFDFRRPIML